MKQQPHNIYIHVPYCKSKCKYCAFFSRPCESPDWESFTKDICNEIFYWGNRLGHVCVPTVFFGGGTPSLVPQRHLEKILGTINKNFTIENDAEITLESNPATLDKNKLMDLKSLGINRLSVGAQRFNDSELLFLGRMHTCSDTLQLIKNAQKIDLNLSADFIYGIPNDTAKTVKKLCTEINNLGLQHCSLYELTIEKNTPLAEMNLDMPNNEEMATMYQTITEFLSLPRYEISSYAHKNHECTHNKNIWSGKPYIGIGQGAAGRILINDTWFEQQGANEVFEALTENQRATEKLLTGLRTIYGCQLTQDVKNVIDIDWIKNNPEYIKISNNRICATEHGFLILDNLITNVVK